jgi:hypothetical protein
MRHYTRLDKATIGPGASVTYHYTFPKYSSQDIDSSWLQQNLKPTVKNNVCNSKDMKLSLQYGALYRYSYSGGDGTPIGSFEIDRNDCGFPPIIPNGVEQVTEIAPATLSAPAPQATPQTEPPSEPTPTTRFIDPWENDVPSPAPQATPKTETPIHSPTLGAAPVLVKDLFKKAMALCSSRGCPDPQKAIEYLTEAIRLEPNIWDLYSLRATVYIDLKQYQMAIRDFNKTIHLRPDDDRVYGMRGFAYARLGQYQQAIFDFNTAIRLNPNDTSHYESLGFAYSLASNTEEECRSFKKACELGRCEKYQKYCP